MPLERDNIFSGFWFNQRVNRVANAFPMFPGNLAHLLKRFGLPLDIKHRFYYRLFIGFVNWFSSGFAFGILRFSKVVDFSPAQNGMEKEILKFLEIIGLGGTGAVASLAVLGLFWKADEAFSKEAIEEISARLIRTEFHAPKIEALTVFSTVFNRVFGDDHFTIRCFLFSILFSFLLVSITIAAQHATIDGFDILLFDHNPIDVAFSMLFYLSINGIIDYISLLKTRIILRNFAKNHQYRFVFFLVFDFLATVFLVHVALFIWFLQIWYEVNSLRSDFYLIFLKDLLNYIAGSFFIIEPDVEVGYFRPFIFSTFFTSIWLWLFVSGWVLIHIFAGFRNTWRFLVWALPVRTKPLRAIGEVAALIVALCFIIGGIFSST